MEPKVTDRVDAVSKAGVSKQTREVNIERFKKRFALHFSFFNIQSSTEGHRQSACCRQSRCKHKTKEIIAKLRFALGMGERLLFSF